MSALQTTKGEQGAVANPAHPGRNRIMPAELEELTKERALTGSEQ